MLREPARHDGISNNQASRDRERERQRQVQQRAQMLPDDKDSQASVQDLFHAPIKVKPSIEDQTSIEVKKTLGSFDHVRQYVTDNGALQRRLIGVDPVSGSPQKPFQPPPTVVPSAVSPISSSDASQQRFPSSGSGSQNPKLNPPQGPRQTNQSTNNSGSSSNLPSSNTQPNVRHNQASNPKPQPPQVNPSSTYQSSGSNQNYSGSSSGGSNSWAPPQQNQAPVRKQVGVKPSTTLPYFNNNTTGSDSLNDNSNSVVKSTKSNPSNNPSNITGTTNLSANKYSASNSGCANSNSVDYNNPYTSSSSSDSKFGLSFKKPGLDRTDSREVESMLREMMDVTQPISAISTPAKESPSKRTAQRRNSKEDDKQLDVLDNISSLTNVPSPLSAKGMESSSSSSSDSSSSDSDSDSSSGSQDDEPAPPPKPTTDSQPRNWGLLSFVSPIRNAQASLDNGTSGNSKDILTKTSVDSDQSPVKSPSPAKTDTNSTSSPLTRSATGNVQENIVSRTNSKPSFTKPDLRSNSRLSEPPDVQPNLRNKSFKPIAETKPKLPIPSKPCTVLPSKVNSALLEVKGPSLSGSSSEDEEVVTKETVKAKGPVKRPSPAVVDTPPPTKKPRRKNSTDKAPLKSDEDSPPKQGKLVQDRNKNDMIGRLFGLKKDRVDSPVDSDKSHKDSPTYTEPVPEKVKPGKSVSNKPSVNRVSGKDNKSTSAQPANTSSKSNGELSKPTSGKGSKGALNSSSTQKATATPNSSKSSSIADKTSPGSNTVSKTNTSSSINSKSDTGGFVPSKTSPTIPPKTTTPPNISTKNQSGKNSSGGKNGEKGTNAFTNSTKVSPTISVEKNVPKPSGKGAQSVNSKSTIPSAKISGKGASNAKSVSPSNAKKGSQPSTKDQKPGNKQKSQLQNDTSLPFPPGESTKEKESHIFKVPVMCRIPLKKIPRYSKPVPQVSANFSPSPNRPEPKINNKEEKREEPKGSTRFSTSRKVAESSVEDTKESFSSTALPSNLCSDPISKSYDTTNHRERRVKKKSQPSPKRPKLNNYEPHLTVLGSDGSTETRLGTGLYPVDTNQVSTTKSPPDEVVPDSSLNPSQVASPPSTQPVYFSYFEKVDMDDDDFHLSEQDYYLNEAKRLKHKADKDESGVVVQILTYLEAGVYFILTGISIEKSVGAKDAFTMYKDTLTLIRYIGSRFRRERTDDPTEIKLMVLCLRCQSMLAMKLYKFRQKETRDASQYLTDVFNRFPSHPSSDIGAMPPPGLANNSPQLNLNTPSPHTNSPHASSLSPAASAIPALGNHPIQLAGNVVYLQRNLYNQMFKHCTNTTNLISALELWETADGLVDKGHVEDFFISIDRLYGPLTLHSTLLDLVRHVKQGVKLLKTPQTPSS